MLTIAAGVNLTVVNSYQIGISLMRDQEDADKHLAMLCESGWK